MYKSNVEITREKIKDCISDYISVSAKQGKDLSSSQKNRSEKAKGRTINIILEVSVLFYSVNNLKLREYLCSINIYLLRC